MRVRDPVSGSVQRHGDSMDRVLVHTTKRYRVTVRFNLQNQWMK